MRKFHTLMLFTITTILMKSCVFDSDSESLGDDFEVSYVDLPEYRNIYFKSQGIFSKKCVYAVANNDSLLAAKVFAYDSTYHLVRNKTDYYIINKSQYKSDPSQENSIGLYGAYTKVEFDSVCLSWGVTFGWKEFNDIRD